MTPKRSETNKDILVEIAEIATKMDYALKDIKEIKEIINEHGKASQSRSEKFDCLKTDVEVIKTNVSNHLQHHTELKQEFQWKTGLIVGIITFIISVVVSLGTKFIFK